MSAAARAPGPPPADARLRLAFLKWQCRVRQMAMRDAGGRPDDAMTPAVIPAGETDALGHVITVLNKGPAHSATPELEHMARRTQDPAQRREAALRFLSATYYQKPETFSDMLTATFPPASPGAARLLAAERCTLVFEAYAQRFDIAAEVRRLGPGAPLRDATLAHNRLFNPALPPDAIVLGFAPHWSASTAEPRIA